MPRPRLGEVGAAVTWSPGLSRGSLLLAARQGGQKCASTDVYFSKPRGGAPPNGFQRAGAVRRCPQCVPPRPEVSFLWDPGFPELRKPILHVLVAVLFSFGTRWGKSGAGLGGPSPAEGEVPTARPTRGLRSHRRL
ncbi:PREDICTED: uncharacterized protein LOC105818101 [Propithecus coquereli]|uniref:uncharacterized protein LOC105818101 n=1 Tax=Propithecus coquereli TaxID=379532 RepID=UPI00063EEE57|nr:PREDICTED: uncharacterized protein LOC105818101 [Propithecus coquereli]